MYKFRAFSEHGRYFIQKQKYLISENDRTLKQNTIPNFNNA